MSSHFKFEHSYASLPEYFFAQVRPTPVASPAVVLLNEPLVVMLGLDPQALAKEAAQIFSGNHLPHGALPIAQAYAGHQFAHFTMLGDGRAILLGEQIDPQGKRWDIQLKGSGQTPYSRRGDGRAALGPMLREYLISEAMAELGIPTTRSLAVVTTGEPVFREGALPGAVLTRIAASHIRVGTFEFAATRGVEAVRALADYAIRRHEPDLKNSEHAYEQFLKRVIDRQARLIAAWMNVGFVHGVMNTDNMAISGETIDYGPCAFMDRTNPATVFSSIDRDGRYAYGNQPTIAQWNLARFAETLLPLLHSDEKTALEIAQKLLAGFTEKFSEHWLSGMRQKLGLFDTNPEDEILIRDLLKWMQEKEIDFTQAFSFLSAGKDLAQSDPVWSGWHKRLMDRWSAEGRSTEEVRALMRKVNPHLIPRNHHVEAVLKAAVEEGDFLPFQKFLSALQQPFENLLEQIPYLDPPALGSEPYRTFCGT